MIKNCFIIFVMLCWQLLAISASPECAAHNIIQKCTLQDSDCLIRKSNVILKDFTNGIPDLGIEKLDEMSIDSKELKVDGTIQDITNIKVEGLSNATINDITVFEGLKLIRLSFDTTFVINYDYVLEGFLFMQPIVGEGPAYIKIKNLQSDMIFFYDIVEKGNGKHILKLRDYRFGVHVKDSTEYHYANLYNGDKKKTELVNKFLNKNWTIITKVYGTDFYDIIYNKIFKALKKYFKSKDLEDVVLLE